MLLMSVFKCNIVLLFLLSKTKMNIWWQPFRQDIIEHLIFFRNFSIAQTTEMEVGKLVLLFQLEFSEI